MLSLWAELKGFNSELLSPKAVVRPKLKIPVKVITAKRNANVLVLDLYSHYHIYILQL